jgi:hypothetical protein
MRIGKWIGGFFVSTTAHILTSPVWFVIACLIGAGYILFYHMDSVGLLMFAGYLLFLAVLPVPTLLITGLALIAIFLMWLSV